ncbi:selenium cofactor biosynthesis protein YqeC [Desulfosporosinus sp. SB140]|uniref:selenium cofactor biosynthesis protein YqeC n=1 Tax=Desulfosporosinus paludis TaxID=3115649 RepID=UPI00388FD888
MNEGPQKWSGGNLWEMTNRARVITLIGAGGKTTCLRVLTQLIREAGYPVTATTTTKVYPEGLMQAWHHPSQPPPSEQKNAYFWYSEVEAKSGKWLGPSSAAVDKAILGDLQLSNSGAGVFPRYWVIEGDGARERLLKCWAEHEPQIPDCSVCGVLVMAGKLWGHVLEADHVHRSEHCADLLDLPWTEESVWRYLLKSPVFWPQYRQLSWVIFLNIPGLKAWKPSLHLEELEEPNPPEYYDAADLVAALKRRWLELNEQGINVEHKPRSLRLAAGDAKEGTLTWFDLW